MLWLAAVSSGWFWVLALLLGLVAGVAAYYGQQSVRQGLLLLPRCLRYRRRLLY